MGLLHAHMPGNGSHLRETNDGATSCCEDEGTKAKDAAEDAYTAKEQTAQ